MKFTILIAVLTFNLFAADIYCRASKNTQQLWDVSGYVGEGEKSLIGVVDHFQIYLENNGQSQFTLEIYDPYTPSRQYSEGEFSLYNKGVSWSLWTRDILLDVNCRYLQSIYSR